MARTYAGANSELVPDAGGSVRVTIPATPFQIQANSGTSIPCRKVIVIASDGSANIRVQVGQACTTTTGLPVPEYKGGGGSAKFNYLKFQVSDVNLLYFVGDTENDVVDILYFK